MGDFLICYTVTSLKVLHWTFVTFKIKGDSCFYFEKSPFKLSNKSKVKSHVRFRQQGTVLWARPPMLPCAPENFPAAVQPVE